MTSFLAVRGLPWLKQRFWSGSVLVGPQRHDVVRGGRYRQEFGVALGEDGGGDGDLGDLAAKAADFLALLGYGLAEPVDGPARLAPCLIWSGRALGRLVTGQPSAAQLEKRRVSDRGALPARLAGARRQAADRSLLVARARRRRQPCPGTAAGWAASG